MALHRDIFWVGRQWAVTGYGMQAVNRRLHGDFDIEAARIWDDGLLEALRAQAWFNSEDFSKGLLVARSRFPEPPGNAAPLRKAVPAQAAKLPLHDSDRIAPPRPRPAPAVEAPKPAAPKLEMRIGRWPAKFTALWRVRIRR
jgi:hypothetical protein